jgi:hypothetical protein
MRYSQQATTVTKLKKHPSCSQLSHCNITFASTSQILSTDIKSFTNIIVAVITPKASANERELDTRV